MVSKKSKATAGALLQSHIARAADDNCFVVMASLDLSMAFDMVNTELLVKRLKIMGMPLDLITLIREWLLLLCKNLNHYVVLSLIFLRMFKHTRSIL